MRETNNYARHRISTNPPSDRGILSTWQDTSREEMMAFIGLILNMGTIQLPDLKDYWSTNQTLNLSFFRYTHEILYYYNSTIVNITHRSVMSCDRFLQIFWNLHLSSPTAPAGSPRSAKVHPLLDLLSPRFETVFKPGKFVAADEAIIAFTGRACFRIYMRGKPHPYGIKAFVLANSETGYVYRLRLYFGKETDIIQDSSLAYTTRVIFTLVEPLQGLGYHVITDRFYSSPELAKQLEQRGLIFTGRVQVNQRRMPLAVKSKTSDRQLQRGEVRAYRDGKAMVLQWKDKRVITILTTSGSCNVVPVTTHRGQHKEKPAVIQLYNDKMLGEDKSDQLASYYAFLRKSMKWWRKVFFGSWRCWS